MSPGLVPHPRFLQLFGLSLWMLLGLPPRALAQLGPATAPVGGQVSGSTATTPTGTATGTPTGTGTATQPTLPTDTATGPAGPGSAVTTTIPPAAEGVPPTPAPAFPGLPVPPASGSLPSGRGLPGEVAASLRPGLALTPVQVQELQSSLSAQGFYRGPIDGLLSGSTRGAIRAFQEASGLPATGLPDADTAVFLGLFSSTPAPTTTATPTEQTEPQPSTGAAAPLPPFVATPQVVPLQPFPLSSERPSPRPSSPQLEPFPLSSDVVRAPYPASPVFVQP